MRTFVTTRRRLAVAFAAALGFVAGQVAGCGDWDPSEDPKIQAACSPQPEQDFQTCTDKCAHVAECTKAEVAKDCRPACITLICAADQLGDADQRRLFQCEATAPCDQLPTCTGK
jgi:hypothetical protein